jgi:predicted nucleic acid-binding protein
MMQEQSIAHQSRGTVAICNTGPLISVFQSNSFDLLMDIFAEVWISAVCRAELIRHGWADDIQAAGSKLVIVQLTTEEEQAAQSIAQEIAQHPVTNDPVAENHLGEAQVIVVAQRAEHHDHLLLLDELAARAIARQHDVKLSGFPGVLLLAAQMGLISAEELKTRLETCRSQGTHYGVTFIQQVYEMAKQGRR